MKKTGILILLCAVLFLSGCFLDPAESLYAIPARSEDYYNLQAAIEAAMPAGAAYCAPVAGENQQPVQMADIDGDQQDEAIVYWKSDSDLPLTVSVFDKRGDQYVPIAKADGAGSSFDHVQYVEIDGNPGSEIVVGRQISDQVTQTLYVYSFENDALTEMMSANYSEFITTDLDANGLYDVVLLHSSDAQNGVAECYRWNDGQLTRDREARMSTPVSAVRRIITGKVWKNRPAVFVASEYGEGMIVTDIFGMRGDVFTNLSLSDETDTAVSTIRDYYVYSCDIDEDGLIELPHLIDLPVIKGEATSADQTVIRWYNLQPDGTEKEKWLTYHNYSAGWYLKLPDRLAEGLSVKFTTVFETSRGYTFVRRGETLFTLTALSGGNAAESGWTELAVKGDTVYAVRIENGALTDTEAKDLFHFIQVDWKTGETD
ncbi:MAG: hypothetical protein IJJ99_01120 [Oscillospiraceae bacterium]|nr:hypothetical protein [Oscillospiraceae bacterium]